MTPAKPEDRPCASAPTSRGLQPARSLPQCKIADKVDRTRIVTIVALAILIILWLAALWFRTEIRAYWWSYRVTRVESPELRGYYAACLSAIGNKALPALPRLLNDPRPAVRIIGVRILRSCPDARSLDYLLARLADPSVEVSDAAALQIVLRPDRLEAVPALRTMAGGPAPTALAAMAALERIGGPQAEQILLTQLNAADDPDVAAQAIDSLGMLGCTSAEQAIRHHLDDHRRLTRLPASQRRAEQAIAAVQGQLATRGIAPEAVLAATRTDPTVSAIAARALAAIIGSPATAPATSSAPTSR